MEKETFTRAARLMKEIESLETELSRIEQLKRDGRNYVNCTLNSFTSCSAIIPPSTLEAYTKEATAEIVALYERRLSELKAEFSNL